MKRSSMMTTTRSSPPCRRGVNHQCTVLLLHAGARDLHLSCMWTLEEKGRAGVSALEEVHSGSEVPSSVVSIVPTPCTVASALSLYRHCAAIVLSSSPPITDSPCRHCAVSVPSSVQSLCCHCRSQRRFDVKGVAETATLAAGDYHTAVLIEGRVFMFGRNEHGRLGLGSGNVGRVVAVPRMLEVVLANECMCGRCVNI